MTLLFAGIQTLAVIALAVAGAHAGVVAAPAYGLGYGHAAPALGVGYGHAGIVAPAYGVGYGSAAIAAPLAKVAVAPVVSSYSTVTKHVAPAPVAIAAPVAKVAAAPAYGYHGAGIPAPIAAYGHGYGHY